MHTLEELGLAKWENWPWWIVEEETAKLLMTYLASVISVIDKRSPLTDNVDINPKSKFSVAGKTDEEMELRNRLLNDILPLPTKINSKRPRKNIR